MDTSTYLYAGYIAFWIIPTLFLFSQVKKINAMDKKIDEALNELKHS